MYMYIYVYLSTNGNKSECKKVIKRTTAHHHLKQVNSLGKAFMGREERGKIFKHVNSEVRPSERGSYFSRF